ncbi:MAG: GyrI-like domain-containing protein [Mariprofundaceae bacterium]
MMQELLFKPSKGFLVLTGIAVFLALFGSILVMWYLGDFEKATVGMNTAPTYRIAYLSHTGSYDEISNILAQVAGHLRKAEIKPDTACLLILDDNNVPLEKRRSRIGYLVARGVYIPAPLEEQVLPERQVLSATFDGGAVMGSYKAYSAMKEWAKEFNYTLEMPALEIYHSNSPNEYQLSVRKRVN